MQCIGTFEGGAPKILNPDPKGDAASQSSHINRGARVSGKSTKDLELMERLRMWAGRGHLNDKKLDPRDSVICGRYCEPSTHAEWYGREEVTGSPVQMIDESNSSAGDVSGPLAELLAIFSDTPNPSESRQTTQQKKKRPRNQQGLQKEFPQGIDLIAAMWDSVQRDQAGTVTLPFANGNHMHQGLPQDLRQSSLGSHKNFGRPGTGFVTTPRQKDVSGTNLFPREFPTHLSSDDSTIAQLPPQSYIAIDPTSEAEDVALIVKRMKAEERKIRNRASAHRSNMRNKAVKEALENELIVARDRIVQLRSRETMLRRENLELRRAFIQS